MERIWILVADASRGRIFRVGARGELALVQELNHPASRARARSLLSDRTGRMTGRTSAVSGIDKVEPKRAEAEHFAVEVAEVLERGALAGAYDGLVLVAGPHFLGLLRERISAGVERSLRVTIPKDLTQLPPHKLAELLQQEDDASLHDLRPQGDRVT